MTPIEIIALITAIVIIVKALILIAKPKSINKFIDKFFKSKAIPIFYLLLFLIVGYFLIQELTIVQIAAALTLSSLFIGMMYSMYHKEMAEFAKKMYNKKNWLVIFIMFLIAGIILWALFL